MCPRDNNQYDRMAILVIALSAAGCRLVRLLERVTHGPPNTQQVLNVAGQTIGRVSANLSAFINTNLNLLNLLKVKALFMGHIIHGRVVRGTGPKLQECTYVLTYPRNAPYEDMLYDLFHHCCIHSGN